MLHVAVLLLLLFPLPHIFYSCLLLLLGSVCSFDFTLQGFGSDFLLVSSLMIETHSSLLINRLIGRLDDGLTLECINAFGPGVGMFSCQWSSSCGSQPTTFHRLRLISTEESRRARPLKGFIHNCRHVYQRVSKEKREYFPIWSCL